MFGENPDFAKEVLDFPDYRCNRKSIVDLHKRIFFCSLIASLAGLKLHFECFSSWGVCNTGRGKKTREDNTGQYYQVTQITRPVFDVVCMRRSEKEPVPEM